MLIAVLSGFLLAIVAPWLHRTLASRSAWLLALLPLGLTVYFATFLPSVVAGERVLISYDWIPGLGITLSFLLDGLSLMFALLISGIGTFVVLYAGSYLEGHKDLHRFYPTILAFMASMLGVVLSDNVISLFVFWELTSITSFMLIGFDHEDPKSRRCALQGLLVTAGGGLALLAGLIMLAAIAGSYELSEILAQGDPVRQHGLYVAILLLILGGTFTKSAQVPFHFWLPNAMAAPTPVSAYLHSATMVKAGVYLMARLNPSMGGTDTWTTVLPIFGAVTMFTGIFMAYRNTEIKKVLAYSTVMALGTLTMLIGISTPLAVTAAMTYLLAHALYKASLFLVAGSLDHATGTKDIAAMGGLRKAMPMTAFAAGAAALSLAGIAPLFGFIAKEMLLEAALGADRLSGVLTTLTLGAAVLGVAVAGIVAVRPFFGALKQTPHAPHEAPMAMWIGPATLASLGLLFGLLPFLAERGLIAAAVSAVHGEPVELKLALWHGLNLPLLLSVLTLAAGITLFLFWDRLRTRLRGLDRLFAYGPERGYDKTLDGLNWVAKTQTRILQNGYLRYYLLTVLLTMVALTGYTLLSRYHGLINLGLGEMRLIEVVVALLMPVAALYACITRSRLGAVATMGAVGFGVALIYLLFSAPDLATTQVLVETLTVILLVLVLFRLPGFATLSSATARARDAVVALAVGGLFTLLLLVTIDLQYFEPISTYFVEQSYPLGHGRNIVNVILVDFRALDTLGEITVLALAAIGVYAMIKLRAEDRR